MNTNYFIFDLDDTLVYEIEYLKSAYLEIALKLKDKSLFNQMMSWYKCGEDVFQLLEERFSINKNELLNMYRNHYPKLILNENTFDILKKIKESGNFLGLISDGRSVTQRNKLKALNIEMMFDKIVISEEFGSTKPDLRNYEIFLKNDVLNYFYIADNVDKDFITPNNLGWKTVCLIDKGYNIHKQKFTLPKQYLPQYKIKDLLELNNFINN
ncbi:MAG TPA: HAD family hydrolase [Flavobacterium sp.]|nr:HAD family hydrolase [Flavobacterium sp.]